MKRNYFFAVSPLPFFLPLIIKHDHHAVWKILKAAFDLNNSTKDLTPLQLACLFLGPDAPAPQGWKKSGTKKMATKKTSPDRPGQK